MIVNNSGVLFKDEAIRMFTVSKGRYMVIKGHKHLILPLAFILNLTQISKLVLLQRWLLIVTFIWLDQQILFFSFSRFINNPHMIKNQTSSKRMTFRPLKKLPVQVLLRLWFISENLFEVVEES